MNAINTRSAAYVPSVTIRRGIRGYTSLFCIPGAAASVSMFVDLAETLRSEIPVYGLQARGLDGDFVPHPDVSTAARDYLRAIRECQRHGPYILLGHSFGGWIAFELALQIVALGDVVQDLFLIDSSPPHNVAERATAPTLIQTILHLADMYEKRLSTPKLLSEQDLVGLTGEQMIDSLRQRLFMVGALHPKTPAKLFDGVVRVLRANLATTYIPLSTYAGRAHLFIARDVPSNEKILADSWRPYATNLGCTEITGNHMTMLFPPHVRALGERISAAYSTG